MTIENQKGKDNISASLHNLFLSKSSSEISLGVEVKSFDYQSSELTFELNKLDKELFLNFYRNLPLDEHKQFKIKLEY